MAATRSSPKSKRSSKPARAFGRSVNDFEPLRPAEKKLLDACRTGDVAMIGADRPDTQTADNSIRSPFLRFLALGGDETTPVHERGVQLQGAWLVGLLDLEAATVAHRLPLWNCHIDQIDARHSRLKFLNLSGSCLVEGFKGDGLHCEGGIFMRHGFLATGEVRLLGANIQGSLDCTSGKFEVPDGKALSCDGATIAGSVFFDDGFHAVGEVRLISVKVGGVLSCSRGTFCNEGGVALVCDLVSVGGAFMFRELNDLRGGVSLSGARVQALCDDLASWEFAQGRISMDGFIYGGIAGGAPADAKSRIRWLELQNCDNLGTLFRPQPWEQLRQVLHQMGHPEEARKVAIAKHKKMRSANRYAGGSWFWDRTYGGLVGYGYRPWRLLWIAAAVWLICAGAYSLAIRPHWLGSPAPLLTASRSEVNVPCLIERVSTRSTSPCPRPEPDYSNFVSLAYSAEVLLPVISLGSKAEWRPALTSPDGDSLYWGWVIFGIYWLEIAFGWLAGLLLVAAVGNLVKRE
jgi:hypothetical protein